MTGKIVAAVLLCAVAVGGCVPMQWQIDRMRGASAKWAACINSEVDNASSRYSDINLIIEHASLACAQEKSGYYNSLFPLEYSREQAHNETDRAEASYQRLARLKLMKRSADFDRELRNEPVPMVIK